VGVAFLEEHVTPHERQLLKHAVDRARRVRIRREEQAIRRDQRIDGICSGCGKGYKQVTPGCRQCRYRNYDRQKKEAA